MPVFTYRALSADGQIIEGTLTAGSRPDAVSLIKERGMRPVQVNEGQAKAAAKAQTGAAVSTGRRSRVTQRDIQVFTGQLAALLKAGIVLSQALAILEEQTESDTLGRIIREVRDEIHGGASLSDALSAYPKHFSKLYCSMIRVGESGGVLDVVLKQLAGFIEAENALKSNILTALAYPCLVVVVGIGSVALLMTVVIPKLSMVFADFGDKLPWLTRTLIDTSNLFVRYLWLLVLLLVAAGYGFRRLKSHPVGKEKLDLLVEKTPLMGTIFIKAQISRFARTMGLLVKSGIPVLQALNLMVDTTSSALLASALRGVSEKVKKGEGLAKPLRETGFFPPMVTNLIAVGEESGSLDDMLFQVAETYDQEVAHAIKRFITMFEPLVIVLMAIGVGGILFAFLLPILNISNMVS
ncbi:MAG TPA: type II secretion system F family protein [bacterium]|nr:type II secretion system F family protein [bacterium]HOL94174.1 type II secretion system F family protein [bacterium]HPP00080.1 type II secretion system F family protein [bacterium]HXK94119.1 type II secretion system F family protein [bacterium]